MLNKILIGLLMTGLTLAATAETVYKWVDGAGQIHYTDLPPRQPDAKVLSISHGPATGGYEDASDGDDYGDEENDQQAGASTRPTTPEPPVPQETLAAVRDDAAKAKAEQCKQAQERYQRYIDSRRLFREENGKRIYLSDQELTEARARAKQSVDDYCS